jgi:transposase
MAHRARSLLVRQRTMLANALRAHLAELGLVANPGVANLAKLVQQALSEEDGLPSYPRTTLEAMIRQITALSEEITTLDRKLLAWHADNEASCRLAAIPGVGIVTATAIAATVTAPDQFRSGICRLARLDAATAFDRRKNTTRRYLQARRPIAAQVARRRRHSRHSSHNGQANSHGILDQDAYDEEAVQGRLRRARQQTGAYCVGDLRCEKLGGTQLPRLRRTGLEQEILRAATVAGEVWEAGSATWWPKNRATSTV